MPPDQPRPAQARARVGSGSGFELLITATAVADPEWRDVFAHGEEAYAAARAAGGQTLVQDVAKPGRFGWLNLAGVLVRQRQPWSADRLVDAVGALTPADLHAVMLGGRRRQLLDLVGDEVVPAAVAGDRTARRRLTSALASDRVLLTTTPWLLKVESARLHEHVVRSLRTLAPGAGPAADTRLLRTRLQETGAAAVLDEVASGIRVSEGTLDRVVLVPTQQVRPIVVWVDDVDETVILHPPPGEPPQGERLRELGRAVGDETRLRLLAELRQGPRTLVDLCAALEAPRTTLLHHLALLRATGLVSLDVSPAQPNVYQLRAQGFRDLAAVARAFPQSR